MLPTLADLTFHFQHFMLQATVEEAHLISVACVLPLSHSCHSTNITPLGLAW
jgi:hypothetical protein